MTSTTSWPTKSGYHVNFFFPQINKSLDAQEPSGLFVKCTFGADYTGRRITDNSVDQSENTNFGNAFVNTGLDEGGD